MKPPSTLPWLEKGYLLFGKQGPDGLKIEPLAKAIQISKSSFYHHFADVSIFEEELLQWHIKQVDHLVLKITACQTFIPDFLELIVEIKSFVYFNRQLLIHRDNDRYLNTFNQVNSVLQLNFLGLWASMLNLQDQLEKANSILTVVVQLFYQQLPPTDFDYEWLLLFLGEVNIFLKEVLTTNGLDLQFLK